MSILDSNITHYVMNPVGILSRNIELEDKNSKKLGNAKFTIFNNLSLFDLDNSIVLTGKKKFQWKGQAFEVKDQAGKIIGTVKRKGLIDGLDKDVWMEDVTGQRIFQSGRVITEYPQEVYDDKGEVVAEITSKKQFGDGLLDVPSGPWTLRILNKNSSRIQLLGLFLSMFNIRMYSGLESRGSGG